MIELGLAILAGLITALPKILTLVEGKYARKEGAADADASMAAHTIDSLLPPPPKV
jgi:hypothetical protein